MSRRPVALAVAAAASLGLALPGAASAQSLPSIPCVAPLGCPATLPPVPAPRPLPLPLPTTPAPAPRHSPCDDGDVRPTPANIERVRQAVLCLVNKERKKRGVRALRLNRSLDTAATRFSQLMVRQGFFDHRSPGGSTLDARVRQTSYLHGARAWGLGENIAFGTGSLSTPAVTVKNWMNSAGHRQNMLEPSFQEIGVGVAAGAPVRVRASEAAATYTTDFGRRSR